MRDKLVGRQLGDLQMEELIGRGSFGKVYKARQISLNRVVAAKVLEEGIFTLDQVKERFLREAEFIACLEHPNIVPVYAAGQIDNLYYFAMRFIDGKTLAEIARDGIKRNDAIRWCSEILGALAYIHSKDMIHRDVKPSNIMVADGTAVLTDFGLARLLEKTTITGSGALIGTPKYFSPEQAKMERATPKSDLFAMGIILYELLTGKHPFDPKEKTRPGNEELYENIIKGRCESPDLPAPLQSLILKALRRNGEYESAEEMRDDLLKMLSLSESADANAFGKYVLHEKLGFGGMGIVYRAEQKDLSRMVALKVLQGEEDDDAELVARFRREAQAVAKLRHPNIVPIHEYGDVGGKHYFTMDLVEGHSLDDRTLPPRRAAEVIRDAARAVQYAHDQGILHRDLKPANLMLQPDGRVFVLDFGLSRSTKVDQRFSRSGTVVGTPAYMPPEQARGHSVNERADVYSLGATLYSLVAGHAPFTGETTAEVLLKVMDQEPAHPRKDSPELGIIIAKAMSKDPPERFATAGELADDLDRLIQGEPIQARPPSLVYRVRKKLAKRKALSAVFAALVIVGVVLLQTMSEVSRKDRIKPLEDAIRDTRPFFYVAGDAIYGKLKTVREAVDELENEEKTPDVWRAIGMGYAFLFENEKALDALRKGPDDGWTNFHLGRLYLREANALLEFTSGATGEEIKAEADRLMEKAAEHLEKSQGGWEGAQSIDPLLARAYLAKARVNREKMIELSERGIREFSDKLGVEEFHLILEWASVDKEGNLDSALRFRPHYPEALLRRGVRHLDRGRLDEALADCDHAIRLNPRLVNAWIHRGWVKLLQKKDGLPDLARAIELRADAVKAYVIRGDHYMSAGKYDLALADLDRALDLYPRHDKALLARGDVHYRMKDLSAAMTDFTAVLRINPHEARAFYKRGLCKRDQKDFDGALEDYTQAVVHREDFAEAWFEKGNMWWALQDADRAIRDWNEAIRLQPTYAEAFHNRALVRHELKKHAEALRDVEEAIRLRPEFPRYYVARGNIHRALGSVENQIRDYEKALAVADREWKHRAKVENVLRLLKKRHQ